MNKIELTHEQVRSRAASLARIIESAVPKDSATQIRMYPVPRGGVPIAYALLEHISHRHAKIVEGPESANVFVDDIIDSGATMTRYRSRYPRIPFFALVDKQAGDSGLGWVVFPWEREGEEDTGSIEDNVRRLLQYIGEDPTREGLVDTPKRVAKAWSYWSSGYGVDPAQLLTCFKDGGEQYDEMILERNLPFYTHCEHHLAPFFGVAHIAYIPDKKIVGLSKLPRVLEVFARRLQVQERLTTQVADALMENLQPKGVAVSITARHLCMESRGVNKQGHQTTTTALRGVFRTNDAARAEFLASIR